MDYDEVFQGASFRTLSSTDLEVLRSPFYYGGVPFTMEEVLLSLKGV